VGVKEPLPALVGPRHTVPLPVWARLAVEGVDQEESKGRSDKGGGERRKDAENFIPLHSQTPLTPRLPFFKHRAVYTASTSLYSWAASGGRGNEVAGPRQADANQSMLWG